MTIRHMIGVEIVDGVCWPTFNTEKPMLFFSIPVSVREAFLAGTQLAININGEEVMVRVEDGRVMYVSSSDGAQDRAIVEVSEGNGLISFICADEDDDDITIIRPVIFH